MKSPILAATLTLFLASQAQLIVPYLTNNQPTPQPDEQLDHPNQNPMEDNAPGIHLPPPNPSSPKDNDSRRPKGSIILSDVLPTHRQITIFAQFTRDIEAIHSRLDSTLLNTTVLAPSNAAIAALPQKPWEDAKDYEGLGAVAYQGKSGEERAQRNLRRFAEAHVVAGSPWEEGERVETLGGGSVWWEGGEGGKMVVMPGDVVVERVGSRVANGEVWVLGGCLDYGG